MVLSLPAAGGTVTDELQALRTPSQNHHATRTGPQEMLRSKGTSFKRGLRQRMTQFKIKKAGKGKSDLVKSLKLEEGITIPHY